MTDLQEQRLAELEREIREQTQNIEWKNAWLDEYIKWICGFANANGGTLEIGKDDGGKVVGISDAQRLMEELPNKTGHHR